MTVLTSQNTVVGGGVGTLPRVNLMPPEVAEARAVRRVQLALGAVGAGSFVVVGLLFLSASHSLSSAKTDLANAQTQQTQLQGQISQLNYVGQTIQSAQVAKAQLAVAMGDEVRYSQVLNDLGLAIPSTVWLKSLSFSAATSAVPGAVAAVGAVTPGGAPVLPIGTMTVTGVGFSHNDVALWLEAMAKLKKTYGNPYFSNSTESMLGARKTVTFTANALLLSTAESGRYTKTLGS